MGIGVASTFYLVLAVLGFHCAGFACAFLSCGEQEPLFNCGVQTSYCGVFSCCGAWALSTQASVVVAHGLSSCSLRALELGL